MKKSLIVLIILLIYIDVQSQQKEIDSLKKVFASTKPDSVRAGVAFNLSNAYSAINQDSAIYYSRQLVKLSSSSKNQEYELRSRMYLAYKLSEQDIPESMKENFIALQLAEKMNNESYIASCYRSVGLLHLYLGNNEKYIDYLQKAIVIFKKLNEVPQVMNCYAEIGGVHSNSDSARYYLKLAANDSANLNSAFYNYYCGNNEKDPQKALTFFLKSISISEKRGDFRGLSLASRWLSIFYQNTGDLNSGILAAKKGLKAAQQINLKRGVINNSEQLSIIYRNINQIDSAYKYQTIMIAAKDSLLGMDKINKIQNSIIEEQQRVQHLETEKNALEDKIKLYVALGISLVFLLLALIFYINRRKTQKSNFLLQSQRAEIDRKNGELLQSLDSLKSTQSQLIQSEKMASLGELTAGIAHEIQNPLNFVNNFSEVNKELAVELEEEIDKGIYSVAKAIAKDIRDNEEKINHHGNRAADIVKGMLLHSRRSSGVKEPTDINALCDEYLRLSYHGLRAKDKNFNATMITDYDQSIGKINIIPQDIGRVILNLINNAFYAAPLPPQGGFSDPDYKHVPTVWVSTKRINTPLGSQAERREGTEFGGVLISVRDNGPGIPNKILDKIFQPFFTTKPTGQGTGLGLSLSYDIVKAHGGELKVKTSEGEGSEFIIQLPIT